MIASWLHSFIGQRSLAMVIPAVRADVAMV
jgi:hypothetical protein